MPSASAATGTRTDVISPGSATMAVVIAPSRPEISGVTAATPARMTAQPIG